MKNPSDWSGGLAPLAHYRELNREERHIAATLYSLMLTDRPGLRTLLEEACGVPCTPGEAEQARVWFEFTFLRDWWHALESEEQKRAALRFLLDAVEPRGDDPDAGGLAERIAALCVRPAPELNALFSTRPSRTTVESPARWSTGVILEGLSDDPDLARRAVLLAWSFRIKPDIVVTMGSDRAVVFEAKWDSPEDKYRCAAIGLTRGQMQLQRDMFTRLLGLAPDRVHSVLLARRPRRSHAAAGAAAAIVEPVVTWSQAFGCFAGAASPAVRAVLPDAAISG